MKYLLTADFSDRMALVATDTLAGVVAARRMQQALLALSHVAWELLRRLAGARNDTLARSRAALKSWQALALMLSVIRLLDTALIRPA